MILSTQDLTRQLAEKAADEARIVGHKTMTDGTHRPVTQNEAESLWRQIEESQRKRAEAMPDEKSAISAMFEAYTRLKELGWKEAMYCPKDGSTFQSISAGSTGIGDTCYQGQWPEGRWWTYEAGDMWPASPILFKAK